MPQATPSPFVCAMDVAAMAYGDSQPRLRHVATAPYAREATPMPRALTHHNAWARTARQPPRMVAAAEPGPERIDRAGSAELFCILCQDFRGASSFSRTQLNRATRGQMPKCAACLRQIGHGVNRGGRCGLLASSAMASEESPLERALRLSLSYQ